MKESGIISIDIRNDGVVVNKENTTQLSGGCFYYAIESDSSTIFLNPYGHQIMGFLDNLPVDAEIISAGQLCLDNDGRIVQISNDSIYGLSNDSNYSMIYLLATKGIYIESSIEENPDNTAQPNEGQDSLQLTRFKFKRPSFNFKFFKKSKKFDDFAVTAPKKVHFEDIDLKLKSNKQVTVKKSKPGFFSRFKRKKKEFSDDIPELTSVRIARKAEGSPKLSTPFRSSDSYSALGRNSGKSVPEIPDHIKTANSVQSLTKFHGIEFTQGNRYKLPDNSEVIVGPKLGQGGFGSVYELTLVRPDGKEVKLAAKQLDNVSLSDPRIQKEFETAELLQGDPHFAGFYGATQTAAGKNILLYEKLETDIYKSLITGDNPLPKGYSSTTAIQDLFDGVSVLHAKGKVHGDLKVENVMLDANGRLRVIDLDGLTDDVTGIANRPKGVWPQTPYYVPPEAVAHLSYGMTSRLKNLDNVQLSKQDVFASGVTAMEIKSGKTFDQLYFEVVGKQWDTADALGSRTLGRSIDEYDTALYEFIDVLKNNPRYKSDPEWQLFAKMIDPDASVRGTMAEASAALKSIRR